MAQIDILDEISEQLDALFEKISDALEDEENETMKDDDNDDRIGPPAGVSTMFCLIQGLRKGNCLLRRMFIYLKIQYIKKNVVTKAHSTRVSSSVATSTGVKA